MPDTPENQKTHPPPEGQKPKNQGYHFGHNYGHGKENLSVVFAMLMMLAFLVDQAQQLSCQLFQSVWKKLGSKRSLWVQIRSLFFGFKFDSREDILTALIYGFERDYPVILGEPHHLDGGLGLNVW